MTLNLTTWRNTVAPTLRQRKDLGQTLLFNGYWWPASSATRWQEHCKITLRCWEEQQSRQVLSVDRPLLAHAATGKPNNSIQRQPNRCEHYSAHRSGWEALLPDRGG